MKTLNLIIVSLMAFVVSSCQTIRDERASLRAAQITYSSSISTVITLRKANKIGKEDLDKIKEASNIVSINLGLWNKYIQAGTSRVDLKDVVEANLKVITDLLAKFQKEK